MRVKGLECARFNTYQAPFVCDGPASGPHALVCGSYSWVCESHALCSPPPTTSPEQTLFFELKLLLVVSFCNFMLLLCCLLVNPNRMGLFGVDLRFFSFWFLFGNLFSTITSHLNLHGFFRSLFRCLYGAFLLSMVVSITCMHRSKNLLGLHSHLFFPLLISFLSEIYLIRVLVSLFLPFCLCRAFLLPFHL
jgi:hypothetical protein